MALVFVQFYKIFDSNHYQDYEYLSTNSYINEKGNGACLKIVILMKRFESF